MCSTAIGIGFSGNEEIDKGIVRWIAAVDDSGRAINRIKSQVSGCKKLLINYNHQRIGQPI